MKTTLTVDTGAECTSLFGNFIETYLPGFSHRDDVLLDDFLFRYLDEDDVSDNDLDWICRVYGDDKQSALEALITLETQFASEAIRAYYEMRYLKK